MNSKKVMILLFSVLFLSAVLVLGINHFEKLQSKPSEDATSSIAEEETQIVTFEDIAYGSHERQTFDLNLPVDSRTEIGLVVFLHGGGWISGDKSSAKKNFPVYHANEDFATASLNYHYINDGKSNVDVIINDITLALQQIKDFAASYSININKVILGGHSAGAHLSMLYAYRYKNEAPIEPVGVFASAPVPDLTLDVFFTDNMLGDEMYMCDFISQLCGTDLTPYNRDAKSVILNKYSPINYISRSSVPTIILHGEGDRIAPFEGSILLVEKLKKYSVNHELVIFENSGHSLSGNAEKKKYASELMITCAKKWFSIEEKATETQ